MENLQSIVFGRGKNPTVSSMKGLMWIMKVITLNRALAVVLLTTLPLCSGSLGQSRDQKAPEKSGLKQSVKDEAEDEKARRNQERVKQALSIIQNILIQTKTNVNPAVRIKIRMLVADAYWDFEQEKAREILVEEFPKIASIALPENESEFGKVWSIKGSGKAPMYKGVPVEQVKGQLRREMLAIISARDVVLARSLVAAEKKNEQKDETVTEKTDEVLATAGSLAESDPEAAARIINESLKNGFSDGLAFWLIKLRDSSPAEASAIFNRMLTSVRPRGDLWEFQQLVPYILPTELDRLIGGKHYLTDLQRMKDANTLAEYAVELLYRRIQIEAPSNMAPEHVKREYYIWRNLQTLFNDLKPESVWLVNTRIRQLTAVLPQPVPGTNQGPWSEEKLTQLIAAAKSSSGEKRDEYLDSAAFNAWRLGQGDLEHALSLAESIDNRELRELTTSTLYFQAGLKYLRIEGPDYALSLARKIDLPFSRTRLFLAIIATLNSVKASERSEMLREELLNWLRSCDKNSDTAWAVLDYLNGSMNDNADRNFGALDVLVRALNGASLDPPAKALNKKIYWYPEFHDFRRSLAPLAKADFERGLEIIQMLNKREVAMQIQASFSGNYLKMHKRNKSSAAGFISKSEQ